jgi:hypothetical protein
MKKNSAWKGMVIGALTGAAIGVLLELVEWAQARSTDLGASAARFAGTVKAKATEGVDEGARTLRDADIPGHLKDAQETARRKVAEVVSDSTQKATETAATGRDKASELLKSAKENALG